MLFFPWDNNSPRDGDPIGNPKPRKSSDVSVVIDPANTKGRLAIIIGEEFGRICLNIILESIAPRDLLALTKSRFLSLKNSALTYETIDIQLNASIRNNNVKKPGTMIVESIISKKSIGMLDHISMNLCNIKSHIPPK